MTTEASIDSELINIQLPQLRQELQVSRGAPLVGGAPSWTIFDPINHAFFEIGQREFEILSLWSLKDLVTLATTLKQRRQALQPGELEEFTAFLIKNSLVESLPGSSVQNFMEQADARHQTPWQWLMKNYLFTRIPLVHPDQFLRRTLPKISFIWSTQAIIIWAILTTIGIFLIARSWDQFLATFPDFFNIQGFFLYGVALILVKILHECGHAYTAVRYGARVSTMGVAIMLLFPMLYTDTTGVWRLRSRRQRLAVDAAGVRMELMVAGLAGFAWTLLPDGTLRSIAFIFATTGWLLSMFINLNPFMRFDGYYFMSDAVGVPNLQERSFAFGKWQLREWLFGLGKAMPEDVTRFGANWRTAFAFGTWIYRIFLFTGIALAVYYFFFKALGIILFAVEIIFFIGLPIWNEIKQWWAMRSEISFNRQSGRTLIGIIALLLLLFLPIDSHVTVPAVYSYGGDQLVVAPEAGIIDEVIARDGAMVTAGDTLFKLISPELEVALSRSQLRIDLLVAQIGRSVSDIKDRSQRSVLEQELTSERERYFQLTERQSRLQIKAPFSGQIRDLQPNLHAKQWLGTGAELMRIISSSYADVRGYVFAIDRTRLNVGNEAVFIADDPSSSAILLSLKEIAPLASDRIDLRVLASVNEGGIAVDIDEHGILRPREPVYLLRLEPTGSQSTDNLNSRTVIGSVEIEVKATNFASRIFKQVARVLTSELGL
ncbi:HlyD family efflux transporter periplasmic adaptor subunit [Pseudocolwellia sp. HL-MZ7]|uniref:HlyD family efflux transporter periplasmic adaptor subunit n=1 Tax=Pseudocolwellia sp. HL-MZ7 TaxID=3400627 RepID=UPI003CEFDAE7